MKRTIAMVAALVAATAFVVLSPSAAQAYGWTGVNCMTQKGNGAQVCLNLHTVPFQNGQRVDQIMVCAFKVDNVLGNHFRGIKNTGITYTGSGGNYLGGDSIVEPDGATYAGVCAYTTPGNPDKLGNGACYRVDGTLDLSIYTDQEFRISGKVAGGTSC